MKENQIRVTIGDMSYVMEKGMTYGEILKATGHLKDENGLDVLLITENRRLRELGKRAEESCTLELITAEDTVGRDTYRRSLNLLLLKSLHDVLGKDYEGRCTLRFSNGNGYYYTLKDCTWDMETLVRRVRNRMLKLTELNVPIHKKTVSTADARQLFRESGMPDKDELFRFRRVSAVNLYSIGDYQDYFFGYMAWHTGYLKYFDVECYRDGLVLVIPDKDDPQHVSPYKPYEKIFDVQLESESWAHMIGIDSVSDLNNGLSNCDMEERLLVAEALQESRISDIAQMIKSHPHVKFVMVAGPSSSGKTTFSRRLSVQLRAHGLMPHPISLDDFYLDREQCPRDEEGNLDFECLESLDLPLIQETLAALIRGERVEMPRFDFVMGKPQYKGDFLQLGEGDILVIEGIHGLNRRMTETLPEDSIFRIYISALTQLNIDEHNHISTTDGRLLRRIVRDYRTRGTDARETIARWPSVNRGEYSYIFPNQENADVMFNSALIYELAILKTYAEPLLFQVPEDCAEFQEAKRLLKFLDYFIGMPEKSVPKNSILREFIGGSCFDV